MYALVFFAQLLLIVGSTVKDLAIIISPGPYAAGHELSQLLDLRAFSDFCANQGIQVEVIGVPLTGAGGVTLDSNRLYSELRQLGARLPNIRRRRLIVYYSGHGCVGGLLLNDVGPFWRRIAWYRSLVAAIRRLGFEKNIFMFDCCHSGSFSCANTGTSFVASSKWYQPSWEGGNPAGGFSGDFSAWMWQNRNNLRDIGRSELPARFEQDTDQGTKQVNRYNRCRRRHPRIGWLTCLKPMFKQTPVVRMADEEWRIFTNFYRRRFRNRLRVQPISRSTRQLALEGGVEQHKGSSRRRHLPQSQDDGEIAQLLDSVEIKASHVDALKKVLRQMDESHLAQLPGRSFGMLTVMVMTDIVQGVPAGELSAKYDQMIGEFYKEDKPPVKSSHVQRRRGRHHRRSDMDIL